MANIGEIQVHDYKVSMGQSQSEHKGWVDEIHVLLRRYLPSIEMPAIDIYNLRHEKHNINAGRKTRRLVVLANAVKDNGNEGEINASDGAIINGTHTQFKDFFKPNTTEESVIIKSEEGMPLAQYYPEREQMDILFDLFGTNVDNGSPIFTYILKEFERLVWFPKTLENSWLHTQDRDKLTARFTERMKRRAQETLNNDKHRIAELEDKIQRFKRESKNAWDNVLRLRRSVEVEEKNLDSVGEKLINDINLVSQLDKVKDVHIINGVFHVFTEPIYAYTENDERFYIGEMKFTMDLENTDVRFFNTENPRNGYWTGQDPHPHVNGDSGRACLGSVETTIAELASHYEVYALALTCIDFLENANISDPAGKKVYNWDMVDEEGNIIRKGGERDHWECNECEGHFHEDEQRTRVFGDANPDDGLMDEMYVCAECFNNHYHYSEYYNSFVHNSVDEPQGDDE